MGVDLEVLRNEAWGLNPKDLQLIQVKRPHILAHMNVSGRNRSLQLPGGLTTQRKENKHPEPINPHPNSTSPPSRGNRPTPARTSLTHTLNSGTGPCTRRSREGLVISSNCLPQAARSSPAHFGHRLRKRPRALPRWRESEELPLRRQAELLGAKLPRAVTASDVMTSRGRQPMKRGAEEGGLGLNIVVESEAPGGGH